MDTALTQKFPFILDRKLAKANGTEDHVHGVVLIQTFLLMYK